MTPASGRLENALKDGIRASLAGALVGTLSAVFVIGYAAIVFSGPLAGHLGTGIALGLLGTAVVGLLAALGLSGPGTICEPRSLATIALAIGAENMVEGLGAAPPATVLASVVALVAASTAASGLAFLALGLLRLGDIARFVPYPVVGGILAATGYILTIYAAELATGTTGSVGALARPEAVALWAPALGFAAVAVWGTRRLKSALVLPAMLAAGLLVFNLGLALAGIGAAGAAEHGLTLGLGPGAGTGSLWSGVRPGLLLEADLGAVLGQSGTILTVMVLSVAGLLLSAPGIELALGRPIELDRDLRVMGVANCLSAGFGGFGSFHAVGLTQLAQRLSGAPSRLVGLATSVLLLGLLAGGAALFAYLPVVLVAGVIGYVGIDLFYQWLWVERRRMPAQDFAIVLLILAVAAAFGFIPAVVTGALAACARFVLVYARLQVIRSRQTAATRLSSVERPEAAVRTLMARGAETLIFELQGYLFFGTASRLGAAIGREIEEAGAEVRQLVVDFRRVPGLDMSAAHQLVRLAHAAERRGLTLSLTGLDAATRARLLELGLDTRALAFATLDAALLESEERVLAAADAEPGEATRLGALVRAIEASGMGEVLARETVPAGATLLRQGAPSGDLLLLERGRLFASVAGPDDREVRVATFLPGAMVGEIGYYAGTPRTATVRAEVESVVCRIAAEALARLAREEPAIAREFHRRMAGLLARRLARTTAELNAVS